MPPLYGSTSTISSTSSGESTLKSRLSCMAPGTFSRKPQTMLETPVEYWERFNRNSVKRRSFSEIIRQFIFAKNQPEVPENLYEQPEGEESEEYLHFSDPYSPDCCPPGLYCVIDDFLSEYELRVIQQEQRASMLRRHRDQEGN